MTTAVVLTIVGLALGMIGAALLALDPIYGAGAKFQASVRATQLANESKLHDVIVSGIRSSPSPPYKPEEIQKLLDEETTRHAGAVTSIEKKFRRWTGHEDRVVNFAALGLLALLASFGLQLAAVVTGSL
jgi:hypothetical protein